jgi:hypothetical protein
MTDIMSFRYDWNKEILAQFHATYYWNREVDELQLMTDGQHYCIDFVTLCRILGFRHIHRGYERIHNVCCLEPMEVSFMWEDQDLAVPDWSKTKLKSFYYIMHNLFRNTLNPKDNATDLNGYITNVLSRFPTSDKFNVTRFIWVELAYAMDDGRRSLPYAPYLMFMIERVTGMWFPKDCEHTTYKIKKTHGGLGGLSSATQHPHSGGHGDTGAVDFHSSGATHRDIPKPSRAREQKKKSKWGEMSAWMKAIFGHCAYTSQTVYEDRLENREAMKTAREMAGLSPLPPVQPPPQFPNLPHLSSSDEEQDQPQEHHDKQPNDQQFQHSYEAFSQYYRYP